MAVLSQEQIRQLEQRLRATEPSKAKAKATKLPGAKGYLNKAEREEVLFLAAMAGKLDELVDSWQELGRPGAILRAAKISRYWAYQAMEHYLTGIDDKTVAQIMRDACRAEIGMRW